ncbi:MAG TPA: ankyrin repeat domain-containing protein [Verrucomicrobiae bacterium]|nr:ankyrin repeat domain-containing protein [Verrucomicrobiae bacterium]
MLPNQNVQARSWSRPRTAIILAALGIVAWVCIAELRLLPPRLTREFDVYFEWNSRKGFESFRIEGPSNQIAGGGVWASLVAAQLRPRLALYLRQSGWQRVNGYSSITVARFIPVAYPTALGSDGEVLSDPDETSLMKAADKGDADAVKQLLVMGVDVNARDQNQQTALIHSCMRGKSSPALIRDLVVAGANVNASDRMGRTPLLLAVQWPSLNQEVEVQRLAIVRQLLAARANVDARDGKGNTALMLAARYASGDTVLALLRAGAEVSAHNNMNETALSIAKGDRRSDIVQLLK